MTEMMRAVVQDELGGPEVLRIGEREVPTPSIGELLVRVHAAGVNPADMMDRRTGVFSGRPPFVLGWDVSGEVVAAGPGVTLFAPGDEVFGLLPFPHRAGAYAEYVVGPARAFVGKPTSLDHVQAASLPLAGLTAWQMLVETAAVEPGQRILITGAAGGVGHLAVQIAKARGAQVMALTSSRHAEHVLALGADEIIDHTATDVVDVLSDLDLVVDVLGGDYPERALRILRRGGMLVSTLPQSLGSVGPLAAELGISVKGVFVESDRLGLTAIVDLVEHGSLVPTIAATYPLEEVASAHSTGHGPGKVVLRIR